MKICRFDDDRLGLVEGDKIADVTAVLDILPAVKWPYPPGDLLYTHLDAVRAEIGKIAGRAKRVPLRDVALKAPVANPGKIIAAPVNYQKHIDEANADEEINRGTQVHAIDRYGLFIKASSALSGPAGGVTLTFPDRRIDHELELTLVIGKGGQNIPEADALKYVAGYTMGLDMSVRGTEDRSYRKSMDTFAIVGPWLVTADEFGDPSEIGFELKVNGETRQKANTRDLIFDMPKLIALASNAYTLNPGDILMTGTPEGVGPVEPGDVMQCRIDGIGEMDVVVHGP